MLKMLHVVLSASLLLGVQYHTLAQPAWQRKENSNWVFPQYLGLNFGAATPKAFTAALRLNPVDTFTNSGYFASSTAVSDADGGLLFYTNGGKVWDRNGNVMPNGIIGTQTLINGFIGPDPEGSLGGNMLQSILILPVIGKPGQYYIFALNGEVYFGFPVTPSAHTLKYSVVDMSLNNSLGDVVSNQKNITVDEALDGMITAAKGDNCNLWLIAHDRDDAVFKSYELTDKGLNLTPVKSSVGNFKGYAAYDIGRMVVSPDRKKITVASEEDSSFLAATVNPAGVELFDFNAATGMLSNAQMITDYNQLQGWIEEHNDYSYGRAANACFSPDNTKLYINIANRIYQYNLALNNITAIRSSMTLIDSMPAPGPELHMRLAPDGRIYLSDYATLNYDYTDTLYLSAITKPNETGTACKFVPQALQFPYNPGLLHGGSVGDMGQYVYDQPDPLPTVYNVHTQCTLSGNLALEGGLSTAYTFLWDDGSTSPARLVDQPGIYWLRSNDFCHIQVDTFWIGVAETPVIKVNGFELSTALPYSSYQWFRDNKAIPGATDRIYTVTHNGDYTVSVTNEKGCSDTSDVYSVSNVDILAGEPGGGHLTIYPNPVKDIVMINFAEAVNVRVTGTDGKIWHAGQAVQALSLRHFPPGIYYIQVADARGKLLRIEKVTKIE